MFRMRSIRRTIPAAVAAFSMLSACMGDLGDDGVVPMGDVLPTSDELFTFLDYTAQGDVLSYDVCQASAPSAADSVCSLFDCTDNERSCQTKMLEVFTGLTLKPTTAIPRNWTGYGGRGQQLAQAGLCMLGSLREQNGLPLTTTVATGLGASVTQILGSVGFNASSKSMKGYRRLRLTLPGFGTIDTPAQRFSAQVLSYAPPFPPSTVSNPAAGTYPVDKAWSLFVTAESPYEYARAQLPAVTVNTPYGALTATPEYSYSTTNQVIASPYDGSSQVNDSWVNSHTGPFFVYHDVMGRVEGALQSLAGRWSFNGWDSQVGFGSRAAGDLWGGSGLTRPDHDLRTPRSETEGLPGAAASAAINIEYRPIELLPSWLRGGGPVTVDFLIYVKPTLRASVAGQLHLFAGEAAMPQPDMGSSAHSSSGIRIDSGVGGKSEFVVEAGLRLKVKVNLWLTTKTLVDINPHYDIPLAGGEYKFAAGPRAEGKISESAYPAIPDGGAWDWLPDFRSLRGPVVNPKGWVAACLNTTTPETTIPPPSYAQGDPEDVPEGIWPCNVCVGSDALSYWGWNSTHTKLISVSIPASAQKILASASNPTGHSWTCTNAAVQHGCMDMCEWQNGQLVVAYSAVELDPVCGVVGTIVK